MKNYSLSLGLLVILSQYAAANDEVSQLFTFSPSASSAQRGDWRIVNDGVMGGRSSSQASFTDEGMLFRGNLSLANNGGFASVRSLPKSLPLRNGQTIVLRVKGDGRTYTFNLYPPTRRTAYSFQMRFGTIAGKWAIVRMPIDDFVAHSFGRAMSQDRLDAQSVQSVGVTLSDKKPGGFELVVDTIGVE